MYFAQGDYLKVPDAAPRVIALLESTQRESHFFGLSGPPYSLLVSLYGVALAALGNFQEGQAQCEKALRFSTKINNVVGISWAELMYSSLFVNQGDGKRAIEHAQQAIKYAEQLQMVSVPAMAWLFFGLGHSLLGDYDNALKYMEKSQQITRDSGIPVAPLYLTLLCMVHAQLGDLGNARSCAEKALELAQKDQDKRAEGVSSIYLGRILGMQDKSRWAEAEGCILRGIKILDELKLRPIYAHGYYYLGELYTHTGQREKARENLEKAEAMYREMGMEYHLRRTQSALAKLQG
jgi:tetratricopeptide (TPR) repeat protein